MTAARAARRCWLVCAALGCGSGEPAPGLDAAAARGKTVYENVCAACHHRDPAQAGALGPELAGASLELIEAKVMRNQYPAGYTPKRPGATMPKYEFLAPNLADLTAYLASVAPRTPPRAGPTGAGRARSRRRSPRGASRRRW